MADTPEAAPVAPAAGTEETPNTTPQTTEPTTPAAAPQGEAKQPDNYGFTNDQLAELSKFIKGQGGYDKAFNSWKDSISKPTEKTQPVQPEQPQQPQQPTGEHQQTSKTPDGYMSPQEIAIQTVYDRLASDPKYAPISDKIRNGDMFAEMAKFGIRPADDYGNVNVKQVRDFLDLYAKTVPATPAATPEAAAAPTVDYVPVNDGKIESYAQAARIIAQSADLKAQNMAEHPQLQAAKEFIKNYLNPPKK